MRKVTVKLEAGPNGRPVPLPPPMSEECIKKAAVLFTRGCVERVQKGIYKVRGNTALYSVYLKEDADPKMVGSWSCSCPAGQNERSCSHVGACMLHAEVHGL